VCASFKLGGTQARGLKSKIKGATAMNLAFWLPALFVLGVVSMTACLAFTEGCARI
jgi:hypothetical protein